MIFAIIISSSLFQRGDRCRDAILWPGRGDEGGRGGRLWVPRRRREVRGRLLGRYQNQISHNSNYLFIYFQQLKGRDGPPVTTSNMVVVLQAAKVSRGK